MPTYLCSTSNVCISGVSSALLFNFRRSGCSSPAANSCDSRNSAHANHVGFVVLNAATAVVMLLLKHTSDNINATQWWQAVR
jgi:hypothetical protein